MSYIGDFKMLTSSYKCPHCNHEDIEVCNDPFDTTGSIYRAWCTECENAFEFQDTEED
ncbi:hypothetical protein [Vibrio phage vB_VhaP_PG11]|nr:hypothetical protein [Vibrio phage vB_VhaP_PG11]